jgi:hypothetical protein
MERRATSQQQMQAGDCYECEVCGFSVIVDEICDCAEIHTLMCCNQPMERVPVESEEPEISEQGATASRPARTARVSAAGLQMYLKGIDYPATKQTIIDHARSRGAGEPLMNILEKFEDKEYTRANEVSREFGKLK